MPRSLASRQAMRFTGAFRQAPTSGQNTTLQHFIQGCGFRVFIEHQQMSFMQPSLRIHGELSRNPGCPFRGKLSREQRSRGGRVLDAPY
jgi:hypothetical protein